MLYPLKLCHKVQILLHSHFRVERRLLRQIAYTGFSLLRLLRQTEAGYLYLALGGRQIAGKDIHNGGFARAVWPQQAVDLPSGTVNERSCTAGRLP